jgi:branched-chain amino acid transport system substrate-binding protein
MRALLEAICKAGLNRARIHDALAGLESFDGVTGQMAFDPNQKNVAPMYLGAVRNGKIEYRPASVEKAAEKAPGQAPAAANTESQHDPAKASGGLIPYARVGEEAIGYTGPRRTGTTASGVRIVIFGPDADRVSASHEIATVLDTFKNEQVTLIAVPSEASWGKATTALVDALFEKQATAVIALDRDSSHLAEQLALKAFVPVIALADDTALTATNVPWIFRFAEGCGRR